jgi:hypothetical protein
MALRIFFYRLILKGGKKIKTKAWQLKKAACTFLPRRHKTKKRRKRIKRGGG